MILVRIHQCGMSGELYSDKLCIDKPFDSWEQVYNETSYTEDTKLSIIIDDAIKKYIEEYGNTDYNNLFLRYERLYIRFHDYFLRLSTEKTIKKMQEELGDVDIEVDFFIICGGASFEMNGYKFVVHSDERVHKYNPHVHVNKNNDSVRYSLLTFERFQADRCPREYIRDERKRIIPVIRNKIDVLMEFWNLSQQGYITPTIDEEGKQFLED